MSTEPCLGRGRIPVTQTELPVQAPVVVIGAGHNSMICAGYLANAGLKVWRGGLGEGQHRRARSGRRREAAARAT